MLKINDLKSKSQKELLHMVSELKGKLLALRFENSTGQLKESHLIHQTKKDIARIFTVLAEIKTTTPVVKPKTQNANSKKVAKKPLVKKEKTSKETKEVKQQHKAHVDHKDHAHKTHTEHEKHSHSKEAKHEHKSHVDHKDHTHKSHVEHEKHHEKEVKHDHHHSLDHTRENDARFINLNKHGKDHAIKQIYKEHKTHDEIISKKTKEVIDTKKVEVVTAEGSVSVDDSQRTITKGKKTELIHNKVEDMVHGFEHKHIETTDIKDVKVHGFGGNKTKIKEDFVKTEQLEDGTEVTTEIKLKEKIKNVDDHTQKVKTVKKTITKDSQGHEHISKDVIHDVIKDGVIVEHKVKHKGDDGDDN